MKKVKIIKGTYGYQPEGSKIVKAIDRGECVDLPEDKAARLVKLGVAVYVDEPDTTSENAYVPDQEPIGFDETPPEDSVEDSDELPELPEGVIAIPEYSVEMKATELREIGKLCGLTFKVGMTKEEMVAALDKHIEENMVDDEEIIDTDPEDAPTFDATEAVM